MNGRVYIELLIDGLCEVVVLSRIAGALQGSANGGGSTPHGNTR
jgi:hypothetical protein